MSKAKAENQIKVPENMNEFVKLRILVTNTFAE